MNLETMFSISIGFWDIKFQIQASSIILKTILLLCQIMAVQTSSPTSSHDLDISIHGLNQEIFSQQKC